MIPWTFAQLFAPRSASRSDFFKITKRKTTLVNNRQLAQLDIAVADVIAAIRLEAEQKRIRRAEIVEEKAEKERRRLERRARGFPRTGTLTP